jgi:hypothetical protein
MSGQTGQSLATFLLSVPVAAIGLMAVFGIPQFAAVIAAQRGDESGGDPFEIDEVDQMRQEPPDIFGGYDPAFPQSESSDQDGSAPRWDRSRADFEESSMTESRSPRPDGFWGERQSAFDSNEGSQQPSDLEAPDPWGRSAMTSTPSMSWSEARSQLEELGVDDFHLEAGSVPDTFTFIAVFTPGDQPDVTYRFEAEASDPLLAVEEVVGQIEDWLADRFASNGQYRSANFPSRTNPRW